MVFLTEQKPTSHATLSYISDTAEAHGSTTTAPVQTTKAVVRAVLL